MACTEQLFLRHSSKKITDKLCFIKKLETDIMGEKKFASPICGKGQIFSAYKQHSLHNNKKTTQFSNGQKI
jgi:hypothetical protein